MMSPMENSDKCKWCGSALPDDYDPNQSIIYDCGSQRIGEKVYRAPGCFEIREGKLEAALQRIANENPPLETVDDWESKYASDNTGDVFDAGVTFGGVSCDNIARKALGEG